MNTRAHTHTHTYGPNITYEHRRTNGPNTNVNREIKDNRDNKRPQERGEKEREREKEKERERGRERGRERESEREKKRTRERVPCGPERPAAARAHTKHTYTFDRSYNLFYFKYIFVCVEMCSGSAMVMY